MAESHYQHNGHQNYGGSSYANQPRVASGSKSRSNQQVSAGIQPTSSFHSVSSMDSSAEMAKYFPGAQTPSLSPFSRHSHGDEGEQIKSINTSMKRTATNASSSNAGPYTTGSASLGAQQSYHSAGGVPPPRQQSAQGSGIPGYSSQIEGITVSEAVVNDVLVDLQSKMINETQQQYQDDSSSGNYFETISPIYIRPANPTIILRSDLQRLRAELASRRPVVARHVKGGNR